MTKPRIVETDSGIQGEFIVEVYDRMQRSMRDRGMMDTKAIVASGINGGHALEIGPGPGYLGLEWLKLTQNTTLCGAEISPDMVKLAEKNARDYGFEKRVTYVLGDAQKLLFEDNSFDAVFTCDSLHEWSEPLAILNEIHRVLKPGGRFFISDLRRDVCFPVRLFLYMVVKPRELLPGLKTSLAAAYVEDEVRAMFSGSAIRNFQITKNPIGIRIVGEK